MRKPYHSVILLLATLALLGLLRVAFPSGHFTVAGLKINLLDITDLLPQKEEPKKDISKVLNLARAIDSAGMLTDHHDTATQPTPDSLPNEVLITTIQFPGGDSSIFFNFFSKLSQMKNPKKALHLLHIGDSQIEGDRITAYLRPRLQQKFGGCGIGFIQVEEVNQLRRTINASASSEWQKHTLLGEHPPLPHKLASPFMNYFRFGPYAPPTTPQTQSDTTTPNQPDSVITQANANAADSVPLAPTNNPTSQTNPAPALALQATTTYTLKATKPQGQYKTLKVFFQNPYGPTSIAISHADTTMQADTLPMGHGLKVSTYHYDSAGPNPVSVTFKANKSPDVYGVSFECPNGLVVDNIPLRGSAGLELLQVPEGFFNSFMKELNTGFIILQFGVNLVPGLLDNYDHYEYSFLKTLQKIKKAAPSAPILVIGVSDMSQNQEGTYTSYPNITLIRDAQKNAAFKAGCAFWDLYHVMGGHNSMVSWAQANPPLAAKDYTHFSTRGAHVVAELLYKELMKNYNQYLQTNQKLNP